MYGYGNKYNNIITLYQNADLQSYVPKAYPFQLDEDDRNFIENLIIKNSIDLNKILEKLLLEKYNYLFDAIENELGALPWIIRSSGDEDSVSNPNAGAYESYNCYKREDFFINLAKTILSGINEKAIYQGSLIDQNYIQKTIPVFFQSLIVCNKMCEGEYAPLLPENSIYELVSLMKKIHNVMALPQLDLEWVIESEYGVISGTSISRMDREDISAEISLGFGLTSTQHCRSKWINRLIIDSDGKIKYQKNIYRKVKVLKIWVVQARKAHNFMLSKEVPLLKNEILDVLKNSTDVIMCHYNEELIVGNRFETSGTIIANTLIQAWDIYLHFSKEQQKNIAYVIVKIGTPIEHAGIMFNQLGITVVRCNINEKLLNLKTAKCYIDFKNHDIYLVKGLFSEIKNCYSRNKYLTDSNYYLMYMEQDDSDFSICKDMKNDKSFIWPDDECVVVTDTNIYVPCLFHAVSTHDYRTGGEKSDVLEKFQEINKTAELYLDAIFQEGIAVNHCLKQYPWFTEYNIGLMWIMMILEREVTSDSLIHNLNLCFEKHYCSNETKFNFIRQLLEFIKNIDYLDCFDEEEVIDIYAAVSCLINSNMSFSEKSEVLHFTTDYGMSPYCLCCFFKEDFINRQLISSYKEFALRLNELLVDSQVNIELIGCEINEKYKEITRNSKHNLFNNSCYHVVVEIYDSYAKNIAEVLINQYSEHYYKRYLLIIRAFLDFISSNSDKPNVVAYVREWIKNDEAQNCKRESYDLEEYELRSLLRDMQAGTCNHKFGNIHQIHNFLHQWALMEAPEVLNSDLTNKLQTLIDFCNTFSMEQTHVLRFQSKLIEIELPMCTHKAAFQLTHTGFSVEFSEPPETKDDTIGRLVALDHIIDRFFDSNYKLQHFYEKQLGSWMWFVYAETVERTNYFEKFKYFILVLRFLLDSSYDFSHTPITTLGNTGQYYDEPEWNELFGKLLNYRLNIYDIELFIELKIFSLSDFFTQISINGENRKYVLESYKSGFIDCVHKFEVQVSKLCIIKNSVIWIQEYRKLRFIILLLVSAWPHETLDKLDDLKCDLDYKVMLAKNLFIRKDVQTLITNCDTKCKIELILHCQPQILLTEDRVDKYSSFLLNKKNSYKLAKQYLLYSNIQNLSSENLKAFIKELYFVPYPKNRNYLELYEKTGLEYCLFDMNKTLTALL